MAEMLELPAHAQARILREQKYPKQAPQVFRTPYYQPALTSKCEPAKAQVDGVELRLSPDLRVLEDGLEEYIYLTCRAQALDPTVALRTAEIAHWVLEPKSRLARSSTPTYSQENPTPPQSVERQRPTRCFRLSR